ncbi:type III polyketide synthase [Catenulispora sp. NL8]|uniref:Type III polyketide synthase n=2 Tax=Catenulispora pinistramenti TaxID=2705254 RepID=A0ABS5L623_9ACTN|nr:3-oxoacyl-[acyl-carrier-protein] synthase III C-terminal domain-containing protein [Catenulispora pinistramenti]MBS2553797.1 type III polyketide synthase [Catenulispora pinistramenti]
MSRIAAVTSALPAHRHRQADLASATADLCTLSPTRRALLDRLSANSGVQTRHTVLPLTGYRRLEGIDQSNDVYIEHATELGGRAVDSALRQAGVAPEDVDLFVTTSVTGLAVPSLDARLVPRLGMRPDVKRVPMFGLGCVGGAAGLSRIHDYLLAWPEHTAVLMAVELCSLNVPLVDATMPDLVVSALFGDGAGAVVVRGAGTKPAARGGVRVVATRSELCPGSHDVLGWRLGPNGFRIVLTTELSGVVERELGGAVKRFLADHGLQVPDVVAWIVHPGGPKVIDAVRDSLELTEDRVATARAALAEAGNLSSASIVQVLGKELADPDARPGPMVVVGLGPGVSIELLLLDRD